VGVPDVAGGLWVVCTHVDHRDEGVRLHQLARLEKEVAKLDGPVVLLGDLNSRPGSRPVAFIQERFRTAGGAALRDTWAVTGRCPEATFGHGRSVAKIDWIFATPDLATRSSRVWRDLDESDHKALEVVFNVGPRATALASGAGPQPIEGFASDP
jgi:endonuclease/exonuclease/phosphatase family metal-dependent hydrolase